MAELTTTLWPVALALHATLCALFTLLAWRFGRAGSGASWPAFVFCFCFFLPGLGPIGLLVAILPALARPARAPSQSFAKLSAPDPEAFADTAAAGFGPGGFRSRLLSRRIPAPGRLPSLFALRNRNLPQGNRMMKELLKDPADELRLMAFGTLERRELDLQDGIRKAKEELREAEQRKAGKPARYLPLRKLAFLNWELVYQELAEGEIAGFYLEQALGFADQALEADPADGALWALQGRILARLGRWDKAREAFDAAAERGAPLQRILPRLAEVAFLRRDFGETRRLLGLSDGLRKVPALEPVLRFWLGGAA